MKMVTKNVNDKKEDVFMTILKSYLVEVTNNPAASKKFLVDIGVLDKKGNFTKNYSALCIHKEQE